MTPIKFKLFHLILLLCTLALIAVIAYRFIDSIARAGQKGEVTRLAVSSIHIEKLLTPEVIAFEGIAEGDPQIKLFPTVSGKFQENLVHEGSFVTADTVIARINRDVAGADFQLAPVKSPINGIVTKLYFMDRGTFITPDRPVAEVADTSNIKVPLNVGQEDLVRVRIGMPAKIYFLADPARFVNGSVFSATPYIDKDTLTGSLVIKSQNKNNVMTIGMSAGIEITAGSREMLMVPEEALGSDADETYVFTNAAGIARKVRVDTGYRAAGSVEITGAIKEGDEVITTGSFKLYEGAAIRVLE